MRFLRYLTALCATTVILVGSVRAGSDPCCPAPEQCYEEVVKKHCVPSTEVVKKTKAVYSCKEVDVCLPSCKFCSLFKKKSCNECNACCEGHCGKPRVKRVLIKKIVTEEECRTKCEVSHEMQMQRVPCPTCPADCCPVGPTVAPESIPAPKAP